MPFQDTVRPFASSRTLLHVLSLAILVGLYSCLALLKEYSSWSAWGDIPSDLHAALSLVLGWLLVFRTNAAYQRWWEARTLWGGLVNASRNLSIKLNEFRRPVDRDRQFLRDLLAAFPFQLKAMLRNEPLSTTKHLPRETIHAIYRWLAIERNESRLHGDELRIIDVELAKFLDICGACERIAKTPFIRSYRIFLRQCIALFLLSFPWGIINDFGVWTIPLTIIVAYFMIGMEVVAEHIEEPFGLDEDDLDLDGLCLTIQQSVEEAFSQSP